MPIVKPMEKTKPNLTIDLTITQFEGAHGFLALEFPCKIEYEGLEYSNAATLFYAMRAINDSSRKRIARLSPLKARQKSAALPENPEYDDNREEYLKLANKLKFDSNPTLRALLIKTANRQLINTVTHRDDWIGVRENGKGGENALGKVLMELREQYAKEAKPTKRVQPGFTVRSKSKAKA